MKESDKFGSLAGHGSRGSGCIAEQRHLAEKVSRREFSENDSILRVVVHDNINPARTDHIHARSRLVFHKHGFARLVRPDVDHFFEDSQLFRGERRKKWNVLKNMAERVVSRAQPKGVSPNAICCHKKANPSTTALSHGAEVT